MPVRRKLMKSDTPGYAARFLRHRLPRLCVALFASSPSELMEKIEHAANENSLLELRLDYLPKPALRGTDRYFKRATADSTGTFS